MLFIPDPGSGFWLFTHPGFRIPDPGGPKGTGSRIRIRNTAIFQKLYNFLPLFSKATVPRYNQSPGSWSCSSRTYRRWHGSHSSLSPPRTSAGKVDSSRRSNHSHLCFFRFQYVYFNIHTNKVFIIFFFLYEIRRHCISVYSVSMCLLPKDTNILLYKIVAKNKE